MALMRTRIARGRRTPVRRGDRGPALPWTSPFAAQDLAPGIGTGERSTRAAGRSGCDLACSQRV